MSMMAGSDLNLTANVDANVTGYERNIARAEMATDKYATSLLRLEADLMALERQLDKDTNAALQRQHSALDKTGKAWFTFGAVAALALAWATSEAIKWETAWTGVTKTTSGSAAQMGLLEDQLRGLTKVLPATHEEIAGVAEAAGQLGVAREDIAAFTKVAIDLGNTTNLAAEDAATSLAQLMNIMKSSPDMVDHLGNTLVALGNNGASTEKQILDMALRVAGAGQLVGATEADVLGLSSAMANLGIESELGGGAIQRTMLIINNAVASGGDGLERFAAVAGMTAGQFASKWKTDPMHALDALLQGLGRVKNSGGNMVATLADLGIKGTQNLQVLLRLAGAGDMLTTSLDDSSSAWQKNNALLIEAEKRYGTTESQVALARNELRDAAIDIGNLVLPAVRDLVQFGSDLGRSWQDLPGPVRDLIVVLGIATTATALFGGAAMMAIPKVAAFKVAVEGLEAGALKSAGTRLMGVGSILAGPWGLALAAGVTALGFFAAKHGAAAREIDAMVASLDQATGAMTEESQQLIFKKLVDDDAFGDLDALAKKIQGISALGDETGMAMADAFGGIDRKDFFAAASGDADELERVRTALLAVQEIAHDNRDDIGGSAADSYTQAVQNLLGVLDGSTGVISSSREQLALQNEVMGEGAGAADNATDAQQGTTAAWQAGATAAGDMAEEVATLGEELDDLASSFLDQRDAQRQVRDSLRGIKDAIKAYRKDHDDLDGAFKKGTKSGDNFAGMLDGLAKDYMKQIETTEKLTGSERAVQRVYNQSRAQLVKVATQLLGSRKAAEDYADQVLQTPTIVQTHFLTPGLSDAEQQAVNYAGSLAMIPSSIHTKIFQQMQIIPSSQQPTKKPKKREDGGFAFGSGRSVARVPQIANGGENIQWAEPATGWEAYISGKPGMESRNRQVWEEAGRRLGVPSRRGGERVVERHTERYVPAKVLVSIGGEQFTAKVVSVVQDVRDDDAAFTRDLG